MPPTFAIRLRGFNSIQHSNLITESDSYLWIACWRKKTPFSTCGKGLSLENNHNIFSGYISFAVAAHEFVIKHKKLVSNVAVFLCSVFDALEKTKHIWLWAKTMKWKGGKKPEKHFYLWIFNLVLVWRWIKRNSIKVPLLFVQPLFMSVFSFL